MRTALFGAFVAIGLAATPLTSKPVHAMALPAPAGMNAAADALSDTHQVACRLVWRCGYYGCGWRRVCWAPRYSYYAPYYRPYYRPFYRPYVRPFYRPYYSAYYGPRTFYGGFRPYYRSYWW
jgi:hypothetical protein